MFRIFMLTVAFASSVVLAPRVQVTYCTVEGGVGGVAIPLDSGSSPEDARSLLVEYIQIIAPGSTPCGLAITP